jgi:ABC-2 type transport system ATP-binding protein
VSSVVIQKIPSTADEAACSIANVGYRYGENVALRDINLTVHRGEIVALLGPNGSGKTTLFRLLCTLLPLQQGVITIGGVNIASDPLAARRQIGIVFQSPSLDKKLTVDENIACQGALYGIRGAALNRRRDELLEQLELTDRRGDYCQTLSGGLKRRVELAKGMLHQPTLLLLDEPSTGLDPSARLKLWSCLRELADSGTSILLTTHILEEADKADRVAILAGGQKIADASPSDLRAEMGEGLVTIVARDAEQAERKLRNELGLDVLRIHNQLRLQSDTPAELVPRLAACLGSEAQSIAIGRPGLEDVFIAKTGEQFH